MSNDAPKVLSAAEIASWRRDPNVAAAVNPYGRPGPPRRDLQRLLAEWACDFEAAAKDAPTRLQATVLMTRAAECRDALLVLRHDAAKDAHAATFTKDPTP
jgi:hypothetical protein